MQKLSIALLGLAVIILGITGLIQCRVNHFQNNINQTTLEIIMDQDQKIDKLRHRVWKLERKLEPLRD